MNLKLPSQLTSYLRDELVKYDHNVSWILTGNVLKVKTFLDQDEYKYHKQDIVICRSHLKDIEPPKPSEYVTYIYNWIMGFKFNIVADLTGVWCTYPNKALTILISLFIPNIKHIRKQLQAGVPRDQLVFNKKFVSLVEAVKLGSFNANLAFLNGVKQKQIDVDSYIRAMSECVGDVGFTVLHLKYGVDHLI